MKNKYIEIIYNLGDKTILYLMFNCINGFVGVQNGKASVTPDSQWSKQEAVSHLANEFDVSSFQSKFVLFMRL